MCPTKRGSPRSPPNTKRARKHTDARNHGLAVSSWAPIELKCNSARRPRIISTSEPERAAACARVSGFPWRGDSKRGRRGGGGSEKERGGSRRARPQRAPRQPGTSLFAYFNLTAKSRAALVSPLVRRHPTLCQPPPTMNFTRAQKTPFFLRRAFANRNRSILSHSISFPNVWTTIIRLLSHVI